MINPKLLSSAQIKLISSLKLKKFREEQKLFITEGLKLCEELLRSSYKPEMIILKTDPDKKSIRLAEVYKKKKIPVYYINEKIFERLSDTTSPQNILSVVKFKDDFPLPDESFIALEEINDPGNLGTIIRTAEWFGYKQVLLSENCADKYNPKLIRATMGSIFRIKIIQGFDYNYSLKKVFPHHKLYGATLDAKNKLEKIRTIGKHGLIFGSESHGLSNNVRNILTDEFKIQGIGADSLNVAVAAGISMYYFRQRSKE